MARCDLCGTESALTFALAIGAETYTFGSFECALKAFDRVARGPDVAALSRAMSLVPDEKARVYAGAAVMRRKPVQSSDSAMVGAR